MADEGMTPEAEALKDFILSMIKFAELKIAKEDEPVNVHTVSTYCAAILTSLSDKSPEDFRSNMAKAVALGLYTAGYRDELFTAATQDIVDSLINSVNIDPDAAFTEKEIKRRVRARRKEGGK